MHEEYRKKGKAQGAILVFTGVKEALFRSYSLEGKKHFFHTMKMRKTSREGT
jgi:hypothetical protein